MKRSILLAAALLGAVLTAAAQEANKPEGYKFTDTKTVKTVPVTNQYKSGTCWCFSTVSFIEEEILRAGGPEIKLSEMWIVRNIYFEKAVKYVRLHGSLNFAAPSRSTASCPARFTKASTTAPRCPSSARSTRC